MASEHPSGPVQGSHDERREHARYEVTAYVDYTGSEVLLYHRIENISLGGICIHSTNIEPLGTVVELVVNFPDLDASIAVQGEVVWINRDEPMDMGIRFSDLDEERKDVLRRYLQKVRQSRQSPSIG